MDRLSSRSSLADEIATRLRSMILSGELKPNERIGVAAAARDLGVSHIPVREAVQRLTAESLVESVPNRGPVVAGVCLQDLHDIYYVRRLLECDIARGAAPLYTEQDIAGIRQSLESLLEASPKEPGGKFWLAHRAFHQAILRPATNRWSERILNLLWQNAERYHRLYMLVFGSLDTIHAEHKELVAAAAAKDGELLSSLLLCHLQHTERTVTEGYIAANGIAEPPRPATERR